MLKKIKFNKEEEKMVQCNECSKTFPIKVGDFKTSKVANENGKPMECTYFVCPHCDKVYIILILDEEAKRMKKRHDASVKVVDNYKKLNKEVPMHERKACLNYFLEYKNYVNFLKQKYGDYFTLKKE